jgi:hypothetical protein
VDVRLSKFKVTIKELSLEYEGAHETARRVQDGIERTLGGLLATQAQVMDASDTAPRVIDARLDPAEATSQKPAGQGDTPGEGNGAKNKPTRQRRAKADSPTALIRELKGEGFFSQARTAGDVQSKLKTMNHHSSLSTISARLGELVSKRELWRTQADAEKGWLYKDSKFDDDGRSANGVGEPVQ